MAKGTRGQKGRRGVSHREQTEASAMRAIQEDVDARQAGPDKQHWTVHDLIDLLPKTDNQRTALEAWFDGEHVALLGSAGVGKTTLGVYMACNALVRKEVKQIVLIRSAVEQREQGHVPGTQEEKDAKFEESYEQAFAKVFGHPKTYEWMKKRGLIKFRTTGNMRGLTFEDSVVIGDEIQNLNFEEINTLIGRLGVDSRLILLGDSVQCDLRHYETRGLDIFEELAGELPNMTVVRFTRHDCQRHGLVKAWLGAVEDWYARRSERRGAPETPVLDEAES